MRGRRRALLRAEAPDAVVLATGARPQPPYWAGGLPRVVDVRDVLEGRAEPAGQVVVVDDLGFHQATSVAELLADRGCEVEIITAGMVVGQDLGITLDMETFNVRAHAKGIRQATDLVVMGAAGDERTAQRRGAAHAAAPPDRRPAQPALRLGGVRGPSGARGRPVAGAAATRRSRCIGSATASRRAGRTPP